METLWFVIIAVLWIGYFVLEGFDFGVGMLLPVLAGNDRQRRAMIDSIGPVWDGNEVWLITAGGATFAAFPHWYATLFSGFYLPLFVILVALIVRAVAFEYRAKRDSARWRAGWDRCIVFGSFAPALLWGIAFANLVRGVPLDAGHEYVGTLGDLLNPYALLGGLTLLALCLTHGAVFLGLKTAGDLPGRARRLALATGPASLVLTIGFLAWTQTFGGTPVTALVALLAVTALAAAVTALVRNRLGWAFLFSAAAIALTVSDLFAVLHPDVMPSTLATANSLTIHNASATPMSLTVMTWVAVIFLPLVLLYQGWSYWVFRHRISDRESA